MNQLNNVDRAKILDLIQRTGFLKSLTYPELCRLVDLKTFLFSYETEEKLIEDGDMDMSLFILLSGEVGAYKNGILLSTIPAGECFGEISFVTGRPRTADIIAHGKVIVIRFNVGAYNRLTADIREKIKDSIILKLVDRIDQMNVQHVSVNSL